MLNNEIKYRPKIPPSKPRNLNDMIINEEDLRNILINELSNNAPWPKCYRCLLKANRIIDKIKRNEKV